MLDLSEKNLSSALKQAIKFSGCRQDEFAKKLGFAPSTFSAKLHGRGLFAAPEIKQIIISLAELQGINRRDELVYFLRLAGLREATFSESDWQQAPLNQLD